MTRIVILVLALIAAGGAALLVRGMVNAPSEPQAALPPELESTDVLVASSDVKIGDDVSNAVTWQAWPKDAVASAYLTRSSRPDAQKDLEGALARAPFLKGEPIIESKLVKGGDSGFMAAMLSRGKRAVSVSISPETGAGGFILPNDYVDVIVTHEEEINNGYSTSQQIISETLLTKIRVLAIDQTFREDGDEQVVVGKTATIELTPAQAEALARAQTNGQVSLALRSLADNKEADEEIESALERRQAQRNVNTSTITVYRYGAPSIVTQRGVRN